MKEEVKSPEALPLETEQAETTGAGAPEVESAPELKGREKLRNKYKEEYPDEDIDSMDDDALADKAMERYDKLNGEMEEYKKRDKAMEDAFNSDGRSASFLMGIVKGKPLEDNLYETFGDDVVDMFSSPEKLEEVKKRHAEQAKDMADQKAMMEEWDRNMPETIKEVEKAKEEMGLTDEQVSEGLNKLEQVVNDYWQGKIDPEILRTFLKGMSYDKDVADAERNGEINGKNNEFEERLRHRIEHRGSGLPSLGGQSNNDAKGRSFTQSDNSRDHIGSGIWADSGFKRNEYK